MGITVDELIRGGYSIYSAMDSDIQHYCEEMFKKESCSRQRIQRLQ